MRSRQVGWVRWGCPWLLGLGVARSGRFRSNWNDEWNNGRTLTRHHASAECSSTGLEHSWFSAQTLVCHDRRPGSALLLLVAQQTCRPVAYDRHLLPHGEAIEHFFEPALIPRGDRPRRQLLNLLPALGEIDPVMLQERGE